MRSVSVVNVHLAGLDVGVLVVIHEIVRDFDRVVLQPPDRRSDDVTINAELLRGPRNDPRVNPSELKVLDRGRWPEGNGQIRVEPFVLANVGDRQALGRIDHQHAG